jgi:formylglycine-generating enzyme required for sulfatase activity
MTCIADWDFNTGKENLAVSQSYITELFEYVETVKSFPENIVGYAAAIWNANGYRQGGDKGWNVLEFLAYGNQVVKPVLDMVEIPAGFVDNVPVPGLLCSRTEITQGEYCAMTGKFVVSYNRYTADLELPVENLTFCDAIIYCNARSASDGLQPVYSYSTPHYNGERCVGFDALWADTSRNGYRLPSPEEWTYLYRAGSGTVFYWGDAFDDRFCWIGRNSDGTTQPVGRKLPNNWALYDMAGNVEELTCNYQATDSRRFAGRKGGDFYGGTARCKATCPVKTMPLYDYDKTIGFRIVRSMRN